MMRAAANFNQTKFILRAIIFLITLILALYDLNLLEEIIQFKLLGNIRVYHLLWFLLLIELIVVFIPSLSTSLGCGKIYARNYWAVNYKEEALRKYIQKYNRRALYALIIWLLVLTGIGILYFKALITQTAIFLIVVLFYFADQFCINVWCPFRAWIVRNKCCNACRIYNWGQCMYLSPLIFIPSFWTYSLVIVALAVLLQWEYQHFRYPERFSEISNLYLRCTHCLTKCKKYLARIAKTPGKDLSSSN
ncbi:MAG TPA: hypothetical protein GXX46_08405 [Peptococcaceae bacterium]|nr:hypothetical protein [Peptococcaceae bacterium]